MKLRKGQKYRATIDVSVSGNPCRINAGETVALIQIITGNSSITRNTSLVLSSTQGDYYQFSLTPEEFELGFEEVKLEV